MALNDEFGKGKLISVQNLIDDSVFIDSLTIKLTTGQDPKMYTKTAVDNAFVQTEDLAKKAVVEAIFDAKDGDKSILVDKLGGFLKNQDKARYDGKTDQTAKDFLADRSELAKKLNVNGDNLELPAFVAALATEDGANGVYTKAAADNAFVQTGDLAKKAVVEAIFDAKDGDKSILVDKLGGFLKNQDKARYDGKTDQTAKDFLADRSELAKKLNVGGDNATDLGVTAMLGKLEDANKVLKVNGSNATDLGVTAMLGKLEDANKVLKVNGSNATDPGVTAMLGKLIDVNKVLKVDGSNATDPGVTAMLGKLKGDNVVVKVPDLITKVNVLGDNATEAGVTAMLDKLKGDNRVVKANGNNADSILQKLAAPSNDDVANVLTRNSTFINAIKTQANADDAGFQGAVKEVMSQQHFEIPSDPSAPISADW